jgi:hypothetical protein
MAMSSDKKLTISVIVLLALGGALYLQKRAQKREEATYTLQSKIELPKFGVSEEQSKQVDQISIQQPAGDAGPGAKVVLKKDGEEWKLEEPVKAKANKSNVDSILDNLKTLELIETISDSADSYTQHGVNDTAGIHAVFNKGSDVLADVYFGHGGSRGQMMRIAGKTGVFTVKGYSSYLYTRDAKQWRDMLLMKFDDTKVKSVDITNEHGVFAFAKAADKDKKDAKDGDKKATWAGKFHKGKAGALAPIARLESSKVDDMLRAYKDLNALDFSQNKGPVDTGLDAPSATLTITLDDGARKVLKLGKTADASNRWVATEGSAEAFTISSYAADWVTSNVDKYQKPEEKKGDKKDSSPPPTSPRGMMGGPGGPGGPPPGMQ